MEADPDLEFEHFLATELGMLVSELRERMSHAEFVAWKVYYGRRSQREELEMKRMKAAR